MKECYLTVLIYEDSLGVFAGLFVELENVAELENAAEVCATAAAGMVKSA
jgi:hypothetical protein